MQGASCLIEDNGHFSADHDDAICTEYRDNNDRLRRFDVTTTSYAHEIMSPALMAASF